MNQLKPENTLVNITMWNGNEILGKRSCLEACYTPANFFSYYEQEGVIRSIPLASIKEIDFYENE